MRCDYGKGEEKRRGCGEVRRWPDWDLRLWTRVAALILSVRAYADGWQWWFTGFAGTDKKDIPQGLRALHLMEHLKAQG